MRIDLEGKVADARATWQRLGDTDYLNRLAGNGAIRMRMERDQNGLAVVLGEMEGLLGTKMSFAEKVSSWVHGRWFRQERVYHGSPIAATRFELVLEPKGDGVVPRVSLEIEPASRWTGPAVSMRANAIRSRWQPVLDALPAPGQPDPGIELRTLGPDALAAFDRWSTTSSPELVGAMRRWVGVARDSELRKMRSTGIADRFGLDREETLVGMLRGVRAGALEVYFSVRCGRCSGQVESHKTLSNVADHASCASCGISFATDLASTVEVLFAPHPSVVPRIDEQFCTTNPGGAPEIRGSFQLAAGQRLDEAVELDAGAWILGVGGGKPDLKIAAGTQGDAGVAWRPSRNGETNVRAGKVDLAIENDGPAPIRAILAKSEPVVEPVPASKVAMLAEFRRELGPAVLAPDVRISARSVALMFTDLSGSTKMYETVGDALAYGIVRDHFAIVTEAVERHGGLRIKTIGDAVMASFHTAADAIAAALEAREAFARWIADKGLDPPPRLNVGVHVGPALAVHSDVAGFDWFGQTVNLAARTQSTAVDGALVFTEAVAASPGVPALLQDRPVEGFVADLKGIGPTPLHRVR
jgi:class 3 adenylate cyclase